MAHIWIGTDNLGAQNAANLGRLEDRVRAGPIAHDRIETASPTADSGI